MIESKQRNFGGFFFKKLEDFLRKYLEDFLEKFKGFFPAKAGAKIIKKHMIINRGLFYTNKIFVII